MSLIQHAYTCMLLIVSSIADKHIYYVVGHGGYTSPDCDPNSPYKWQYQTNVHFLQNLGEYIFQWEEQIPKLIEIENGQAKDILDNSITWVASANHGLKPAKAKVVHNVPTILLAPIENPYGGVYEAVYDDGLTTVKSVQKLWDWPPYDVDVTAHAFYRLTDIANWIDNVHKKPGDIIFLACLETGPNRKLLDFTKPNIIEPPQHEHVRVLREKEYQIRLAELSNRATKWFNDLKSKDPVYWKLFETHIKKDAVLKHYFLSIERIMNKENVDTIGEPFYLPFEESHKKEVEKLSKEEKEFRRFTHLKNLNGFIPNWEEQVKIRYDDYYKASNYVKKEPAMVISGSNYPLSDESSESLPIISDNYYHEYGSYNHYGNPSSNALIIVMISLICIGATCLLSVIIGIVAASKYYQVNKDQTNYDIEI